MVFTQLEFPIFFLFVLGLVWATKCTKTRNYVLWLASYYFYAYWDYRFCGLLFFSTLVDYFVARQLFQAASAIHRRGLLSVSLVANLGLLAYFKYANFFIDSARELFQQQGLGSQSLDIILPVGISFYTFQTLSYTIDVYRRRVDPVDRFVDFALYVSFFPQLVAGPIVRATELLPQLAKTPEFSRRRFYGGFQQMLRGAVKKVLLADRLGEMVDVVFAGPDLYSGVTVWIAVVAYAGQIYYDFSGYTDIAIGAAKMLGYRFPANFRHPYLATSLTDFWRRWHMTLSRWFRDYVYIPLGGSRATRLLTSRNLLITMLVAGLWHGAQWTFVTWGFIHGLVLVISQPVSSKPLISNSVGRVNRQAISHRLTPRKFLGWLGTMLVVLMAWVLFRADGFATAVRCYQQMLFAGDGITWLPPLAIAAMGMMFLEHAIWRTKLRRCMRLPMRDWYSPIATAVMIWCLILYAPQGFRPFVYFQF